MSNTKCQSCKRNDSAVDDAQDNPDYPYRVCRPCHQRLIGRCLRPLEYFNLKALHGETYLLQDDFYDDDGTAAQPDYPVFNDHRLAFPTLDKNSNDLERLIDFAVVSYWLKEETVELLKELPKEQLLQSLDRRLNENRNNSYRMFEIVAMVLGTFASDWVRTIVVNAYSQNDDDETISMYSEMLARCLPKGEGFDFCVDVLDTITTSRKLNSEVHNLIYFQDEGALHWIEANIHRMETLSPSWGRVAAASGLSWPRVVEWLDSGRPLSLVALDGLYNCSVMKNAANAGMWFRQNPVRLLEPATIDEMNRALLSYLENDNVPRTRNQIEFVISNWDRILKTDNDS